MMGTLGGSPNPGDYDGDPGRVPKPPPAMSSGEQARLRSTRSFAPASELAFARRDHSPGDRRPLRGATWVIALRGCWVVLNVASTCEFPERSRMSVVEQAEVPAGEREAAPPPGLFGFLDRLTEVQMSLLVVAIGLLLYIPFAGSYGLWDPWETHYSEVARQMVKRADYISLWWPGSPRDAEVFWSKPVLTFWLMAIGMHIARVGLPGGDPGEMALTHRAEWAVRVPFCLLGVLGMWAVYLVVARFVNRRAGFLSALVLATCPMFSLVARQAMTDMAFVGP